MFGFKFNLSRYTSGWPTPRTSRWGPVAQHSIFQLNLSICCRKELRCLAVCLSCGGSVTKTIPSELISGRV